MPEHLFGHKRAFRLIEIGVCLEVLIEESKTVDYVIMARLKSDRIRGYSKGRVQWHAKIPRED